MSGAITIVTGVPRSGTSLVMQMLRAGGVPIWSDGVRQADADNPRGYLELEAAKRTREDARWIDDATGRAVKLVHALVPSLPGGHRYRLILVRRRFEEVLASQRVMLARQGNPDDGLDDGRLTEIFESQLDEVAGWVQGQGDAALLRVDHGALLSDPAGSAAVLAAFLGGGLDEPAMAAAVDRDLWRQRAGATESRLVGSTR